jgi:hypothetical protein
MVVVVVVVVVVTQWSLAIPSLLEQCRIAMKVP